MKISDPKFARVLRGLPKMRGGKLYSIDANTEDMIQEEMRGGINVLKRFLKKHARFYEFLRAFFSPGMSIIPHMTPKKAIARAFPPNDIPNKIMINIGAGVKPINSELINIDVCPYENTDIVSEGSNLPFKDNTINLIICESVIEHVTDPMAVFDEIKRVLAPGGYAYISVPFIYPFHASPNDFMRFSRNALRDQFKAYELKEEGIRAGPMSALQGLLMHLCAITLSFGSYNLYLVFSNLFMVIFAPLKLLDILFAPFPYSHEIAADIYIFVRKT